jgi:ribonuclease-3
MSDWEDLEQRLGHIFNDPGILREALTHRSFGTPHNERLEFLGDSVLNLAIASELFAQFADLREGDLSRLRAALVREQTLHELALELRLGEWLRLGEGEHKSGGVRRASILADALEALFGAIYSDGGFPAARAVIRKQYGSRLALLDPALAPKDPKTRLQELVQARHMPLPVYAVVSTRGAAHDQVFEVRCTVDGLELSTTGTGASRRHAEQDAARQALELIDSPGP